jgi:hypothetical protein
MKEFSFLELQRDKGGRQHSLVNTTITDATKKIEIVFDSSPAEEAYSHNRQTNLVS